MGPRAVVDVEVRDAELVKPPMQRRRRLRHAHLLRIEAPAMRASRLAVAGSELDLDAYAPASGTSPAPQPDHVDTGYAARLDQATGTLNITAPPSGIMAVGGYRFLAHDLQEWAKRLGQGALLTALPDRLSGHRLAGRAQDNARAREAFSELGLNPLMAEAFRDSSAGPGSSVDAALRAEP